MEYDAITVDTNIFTINGYDLEGGLLSKLKQFKDTSVQIVLSEIVIRELFRHLVDQSKEAKANLERAVNRAGFCQIFGGQEVESLRQLGVLAFEPKVAARQRVKIFFEQIGAHHVNVSETDIDELVKCYFDVRPPFEGAGKKKNEFPDAIALLSLERWAVRNGKRILAVSQDKGWKDFAAKSEWIDVEEDLVKALETLQQDVDVAANNITKFIAELSSEANQQTLRIISDAVANMTAALDFDADASAGYRISHEYVDAEFKSFTFNEAGLGEYFIDIIESSEKTVVACVDITIDAKFRCDFNFFMYESVDKDEISMGECSANVEQEFGSKLIMSFTGNYKEAESLRLESVELIDEHITVDFGYVEPDYGEPDTWPGMDD